MKKIVIAAAALAFATNAHASTVLFNFGAAPHLGNIGNTETYTNGGLSVYASGFTAIGHTTDLYGKHSGGDENGLGLADDPSGEHEIHYGSGFVQLDVHGLFGKVKASSLEFGTNSTTGGEAWAVYGTNTAGTLSGSSLLVSGSSEGLHFLSGLGLFKYYDFVETSKKGGENFLITELQATSGTPEPATWAMMFIGLAFVGGALRRKSWTSRATA